MGLKIILVERHQFLHADRCLVVIPTAQQQLPAQLDYLAIIRYLLLEGGEHFICPFKFTGIEKDLQPQKTISLTARKEDGRQITFSAMARIDSPVELEYYRHGGILNYVLRHID